MIQTIGDACFFLLRDGELPAVTSGNMSVGHVREVVKAHLFAVKNGESGERYILGGDECTFDEFVELIADISGVSNTPRTIPEPLLKLIARFYAARAFITGKEPDITPEVAELMTLDVRFSSQKAQEELGYKILPVRKSLQDCYDWLKKENIL